MPGTHPQGREEEADGAADNRYGERNGPDNIVLPAADLSLIDVGDRYRSLLPLLVPADDAEHRLVRDRYRLVDSTLVVDLPLYPLVTASADSGSGDQQREQEVAGFHEFSGWGSGSTGSLPGDIYAVDP